MDRTRRRKRSSSAGARQKRLLLMLTLCACGVGLSWLVTVGLGVRHHMVATAPSDDGDPRQMSAAPDGPTVPPLPTLPDCDADASKAADALLAVWSRRVRHHFSRLRTLHPAAEPLVAPNTSALLEAVGLATGGDLCYAKFVHRAGKVTMEDAFAKHCSDPGLAAAARNRAALYEAAFTEALKGHLAESGSWGPFAFYIDLTGGSRMNPELRESMQVPTLADAVHPDDRTALPVPDMFALLAAMERAGMSDRIPETYRHMAQDLVAQYWPKSGVPPWSERAPKAVYRGSCFPTVNSADPRPHERLMMRSELCDRVGHHTALFDVGTYTRDIGDSPCSGQGAASLAWCRQCDKCGGERRLSREEQRGYKFALLLDSFGPGFDASLWKLLSGAAVFQVNPDSQDDGSGGGGEGGRPLWATFYSPYLVPKRHYFPSAVSRLADAVAWCRDNDGRCAEVARAGRERAECALRPGVVLGYLWGALKRVHDFHYKDRGREG